MTAFRMAGRVRDGFCALLVCAPVLLTLGCAPRPLPAPTDSNPTRSLAVYTGGPARSTIYLERVDNGVIVIDLGWIDAETALVDGLARMGATPQDIVGVFLTHSHRDHVAAWKIVRTAPFHLAVAEVSLLFGESEHRGWIPKSADLIHAPDLPKRDEVNVAAFTGDTAYAFGRDTLRAFNVPGHTAGSAAYLMRATLFAGDAVSKIYFGPYVPALPGYSDDREETRRSLSSLRHRLKRFTVERICTAHAACRKADDEFWREVLGK